MKDNRTPFCDGNFVKTLGELDKDPSLKVHYPSGKIAAIQCCSGDGYHNRYCRLAQYLGGKWDESKKAYLIPIEAVGRFYQLLDIGVDVDYTWHNGLYDPMTAKAVKDPFTE